MRDLPATQWAIKEVSGWDRVGVRLQGPLIVHPASCRKQCCVCGGGPTPTGEGKPTAPAFQFDKVVGKTGRKDCCDCVAWLTWLLHWETSPATSRQLSSSFSRSWAARYEVIGELC